jgi:hypothetical protein
MNTPGPVPVLPDGIFPNQNLQFWFILRGRGMENFEIVYSLSFYETLVYFCVSGYIYFRILVF